MELEVTLERGFLEGKSCSLSLKFNWGPSSKPPRKLGLKCPRAAWDVGVKRAAKISCKHTQQDAYRARTSADGDLQAVGLRLCHPGQGMAHPWVMSSIHSEQPTRGRASIWVI